MTGGKLPGGGGVIPSFGTPGASAPGDVIAAGVSALANRADHRHGRESFAVPTVGLAIAAAAGAAGTLIRSDATLPAFDATVPVTQAFGDAAAAGTAAVTARRDHKHGMPANPTASFAIPAIALGTAAAAGVAATVIRSDATIVAFDATVPVTQAIGDAAATGVAAVAARRDHKHGMPAQIAGATDVLAGMVTQGLRAASANPPLNLGTGAVTAGATSLTTLTTSGFVGVGIASQAAVGLYMKFDMSANTPITMESTAASGGKFSFGVGVGASAGDFCIYDNLAGALRIRIRGTGSIDFMGAAVSIDTTGLQLAAGKNIALATATGTIIATSTTQLLGFYGVTPVGQRSGAAQAAVVTTAAQLAGFGYATQAQADAIVTLVNEMRAWAVAQGFIKGSA